MNAGTTDVEMKNTEDLEQVTTHGSDVPQKSDYSF